MNAMRARLVPFDAAFASYPRQEVGTVHSIVPGGTEGFVFCEDGQAHRTHWFRTEAQWWVPVHSEHYEEIDG